VIPRPFLKRVSLGGAIARIKAFSTGGVRTLPGLSQKRAISSIYR